MEPDFNILGKLALAAIGAGIGFIGALVVLVPLSYAFPMVRSYVIVPPVIGALMGWTAGGKA